ncbi:hypothetical protein [Luteipulveratus mongoliensis]|uniref:Uncharacterized protein n=1 Tax=Luteipulveratus mongoliensis TaxID=571913 RepID=A0A0K1JGB9_9MICO|nr:hypothetical protein [Luteipulveratus mongoliensis]AKU15744.1 hypothetical protein VV02_07585 [Luteipulveratus mongoliensis]
MIGLVRLIDEHPDELDYELRAWSGARLQDFPSAEVTWHDLAVLVRVSGRTPDTALFRVMNPKVPDRYSREMALLDLTRYLLQSKFTASAPPIKFAWEEDDRVEDTDRVEHRKFDAMTLDEAAERLGGDPRMVAAFKRAQLTAVA